MTAFSHLFLLSVKGHIRTTSPSANGAGFLAFLL